jgi:pyruvate/2-oxoglutarate dehydrogenase complex dihydrolipoamide acyltransferase (E2) component
MEEGKLAKWVVKEGDTISAGDVIAEIETDKATMEVEAVDEGRMGKFLVGEGTEAVKVNTPIALILSEGEDASSLNGASAGASDANAKPEERAEKGPGDAVLAGGRYCVEGWRGGRANRCQRPRDGERVRSGRHADGRAGR